MIPKDIQNIILEYLYSIEHYEKMKKNLYYIKLNGVAKRIVNDVIRQTVFQLLLEN